MSLLELQHFHSHGPRILSNTGNNDLWSMLPFTLLCATSNAAALSDMTLDFDLYLYTVIYLLSC